MSISSVFKEFCTSIQLVEKEKWRSRIGEITKKINKKYYNLDNNDRNHKLQVGSVGRYTAINSVSDYDILFNLPWDVYNRFNKHKCGQSDLLQEVKNCIKERYPNTDISGDGQVVDITFSHSPSGLIEVVPAFENKDKSFQYPDTHEGGSWKKTNPRPEQEQSKRDNINSKGTYRDLTRILRVWKNNVGFEFKGILIDTLVDNFYAENYELVNESSYSNYPKLIKELFCYLKKQDPNRQFWYALGSNQKILTGGDNKFIRKAKVAFKKLDNIDIENEKEVLEVFKDLLGYRFSKIANNYNSALNEQFASSFFDDIDIVGTFDIECSVESEGFRPHDLYYFIRKYGFVKKSKKLTFKVINEKIPPKYRNYKFYWKVRNFGDDARRANSFRGQIVQGTRLHKESTLYKSMRHYVECYIVWNNIVIARQKIVIPIGV